jgi:hypothetical protein
MEPIEVTVYDESTGSVEIIPRTLLLPCVPKVGDIFEDSEEKVTRVTDVRFMIPEDETEVCCADFGGMRSA